MPSDLKKYCFTNNELGDEFVGIRSANGNLQICFPLGFGVGNDTRADIRSLVSILLKHNKALGFDSFTKNKIEVVSLDFPLLAYKSVIEYFLSNGYYIENKSLYENSTKGKINFARTIKKNKPLIQNINTKSSFVYTNFQVKNKTINENELITAINKYCVYEAFSKFGFIYTSFVPSKTRLPASKSYCIYLLDNKLHSTFNDSKRALFNAMKNMLLQSNNALKQSNFKFGTTAFHTIWEQMIDVAFGEKGKEKYFPKTKYILQYSSHKYNHSLQPDSIMILNDKFYILDAKYYKYGVTAKSNDLPESSSIVKQIVYGEHLSKIETNNEVFNAFILPYNRLNNFFNLNQIFENIGFAICEWRTNTKKYENIQVILVDTKFLIYNYNKVGISDKEQLVKAISNTKI
ncbi:type II restriction endonuclease, LlaJI family [Campylobacter iguaniorum]|uniref:LlaJI family restriction endonuclease n=1 Tax=Campylobacter iguaniorum TaxID=1244531 RepID=UPI0007C985F3|nr:LlaJI family restriction endonuclease [Campylobacter iguaniorum]ANE35399.1 type II restriction endonuclease, LlaJI family [Campylobacter iguaniorum]